MVNEITGYRDNDMFTRSSGSYVDPDFKVMANQPVNELPGPNEQRYKWWGDIRSRPGAVSISASRLPGSSEDEQYPHRDQWNNTSEFLLSSIGMTVGIKNIWGFPNLAFKSGGGAFLCIYIVLHLLVGLPMFFMEMVLGQFSGKGVTKIWDMSPSAKGIGISMCVLAFILSAPFSVILSYTLHYFFASMQVELPWMQCLDQWVRKENCVPRYFKYFKDCTNDVAAMDKLGSCMCTGNRSIDSALSFTCTKTEQQVTTASQLYFRKTVLQFSRGLEPEHIGTPIPLLAFYLFLNWTVVSLCVIKGIKSFGKVVYITATLPGVILFALLIHGCQLDGAWNGMITFLLPDWGRLRDLSVWFEAANQLLVSLSISGGGTVVFGSFNKFSNTQICRDAIIISTVDLLISVLGGLVVFTTIGTLAHNLGTTIENLFRSERLTIFMAFIVYPEALANMPQAQLWSALFFLMVFMLGIDSQFAIMEIVLTSIQDEFPYLRFYKGQLSLGFGFVSFLLALPGVCPGGFYVAYLLHSYGVSFPLLIICYVEVTTVAYVYGYGRFMMDIEYMLGKRPWFRQYWLFTWSFTVPLTVTSLFFYNLFSFEQPRYLDGRPFPLFATLIGWGLVCAVLLPMPLWLAYMFWKSYSEGGLVRAEDRRHFLFAPNIYWNPNDGRQHPGARQVGLSGENNTTL